MSFKLSKLSRARTDRSLKAFPLANMLLHFGLLVYVAPKAPPDPCGISNKQSCSKWGTSLTPISCLRAGYFWRRTLKTVIIPARILSSCFVLVSLGTRATISAARLWISVQSSYSSGATSEAYSSSNIFLKASKKKLDLLSWSAT